MGCGPWSCTESDTTEATKQQHHACVVGRKIVEVYALLCACTHAELCLTLCDPVDYSPLGSSVHRILRARILEWVAMPSSRGSPNKGTETGPPALQARFFTTEPPGKGSNTSISYLIYVIIFLTLAKKYATYNSCKIYYQKQR